MINIKQPEEIKRILILGHTGFVGSNLEEFLCKHLSGVEIIGYSSSTMDLTREEKITELSDKLDSATAVVMCSMLKKEAGDNLDSFSRNMAMTINLCRLLEKYSVRRFVYISSTAVYGEEIQNNNITEETGVQPTSYYGMAKFTSECMYRKVFAAQQQSSLLILRPPLIYGAGDRSAAYGPAGFIRKALASEPITLWGNGLEKREFIFIDDMVEIMASLILNKFEGVVNIVSGQSNTFKDILDIVSSLTTNLLEINTRERSKHKVDHGFSNKKLIQLLPGISFTSLDEGVRKTFDGSQDRKFIQRADINERL